MFKTSGFIKRQLSRTVNIISKTEFNLKWLWQAIKHGCIHTWHGMVHLYHDGLWFFVKKKNRFTNKYAATTYKDKVKLREV